MKAKRALIIISVLVIIMTALYMVHPPGQPPEREDIHAETVYASPLFLSQGNLPGITWTDDIHPIFVRNKCGHCHTRGKEAIAEGFEELALGIIDPDDESNDFYSYHELVYAEGPPEVQEGETLRDGQCCWPRNHPPENQRRIWIGHPGRSVLMRKLEHDYYDSDRPPRFFEEGLQLKWGLPMPMYRKGEEDHGDYGSGGQGQRQYDIRPFYRRIFLNLSLWLGGSRDELHQWPAKIHKSDRMMLRYWISDVVQLMNEGTGIRVQVRNEKDYPAENAKVTLVGNYNNAVKREVNDKIVIITDSGGTAALSFPKFSVIKSTWFAGAEKDGITTKYFPLTVKPDTINQIVVTLVDGQ
ncbi:MAG: hypothetical protein L0958_06645 [Candidatus Mariimomonas ferrooxydans]